MENFEYIKPPAGLECEGCGYSFSEKDTEAIRTKQGKIFFKLYRTTKRKTGHFHKIIIKF